MDSDFLLIQKMKMGDESAIDSFVYKYYPSILQYCQIHIRDRGYAEDMTQETFLKFFRSLREYQHYGKAANYLYVIAGNVCRDYYKKYQELLIDEGIELISNETVDLEQKISMGMALNALPSELKEVAILYFCQELKQKEIAQILNISLSLVKYRVRKAREQLQHNLGEEEIYE